jgi:hypothetical protein
MMTVMDIVFVRTTVHAFYFRHQSGPCSPAKELLHNANSCLIEHVAELGQRASALCQASSGLPQLSPMRRQLPDLIVWKRIFLHKPVSKLSTNDGSALGKDADMRDAASSLTLPVAERGINTTPARCEREVRRSYGRLIPQIFGNEALWYGTPVNMFSCAALLSTTISEAVLPASQQR